MFFKIEKKKERSPCAKDYNFSSKYEFQYRLDRPF